MQNYYRGFQKSIFIRGIFLIVLSIMGILSRLYILFRGAFINDLSDVILLNRLILILIGIAFSVLITIFLTLFSKEDNSAEIKRFMVISWISIGLEVIAVLYQIFNNSIILTLGAPLILFELGPGISRLLILISLIIQFFGWKNFNSYNKISKLNRRGGRWIQISLVCLICLNLLDTFHQIVETLYLDLGLFIGDLYSIAESIFIFGGIGLIIIGYFIFQIPGHFMIAQKTTEKSL